MLNRNKLDSVRKDFSNLSCVGSVTSSLRCVPVAGVFRFKVLICVMLIGKKVADDCIDSRHPVSSPLGSAFDKMAADACQLSPCQDGGTLNTAHLHNQGPVCRFKIIAFAYAYFPRPLLVMPVIHAAFEQAGHMHMFPLSPESFYSLSALC